MLPNSVLNFVSIFQVIIGTLASHFGKFHDKFHMKIVGDVPAG